MWEDRLSHLSFVLFYSQPASTAQKSLILLFFVLKLLFINGSGGIFPQSLFVNTFQICCYINSFILHNFLKSNKKNALKFNEILCIISAAQTLASGKCRFTEIREPSLGFSEHQFNSNNEVA